jgi:ComF family protein
MGIISINTKVWKQGQQQFLSMFLSGSCALCQRPSAGALCPSCQRQVRQAQLPDPLYQGQEEIPVISWGAYEGSLKRSIASLKYEHRRDLGQFLGTELAQTWLKTTATLPCHSPRSVAILPIPLHTSRWQQRGFNQADTLAQWFCRVTHLPLHRHVLKRIQATQAQHGLNRQERFTNLAQAFAVDSRQRSRLQQPAVWLLDDIFTTGATTLAATQVLREHGIAVAGICTVARTLASVAPPELKLHF